MLFQHGFVPLALAILEDFDTIGVWGVHLTHKSVYARQRAGGRIPLGGRPRRGIEVVLPRQSLEIPGPARLPRVDVLYGYDWQSPKAWWRRRGAPAGER